MAHKLRLEFPDGVYYVISRDNYRADVFAAEKTKAPFEVCLFHACVRPNMGLHAHAVTHSDHRVPAATAQSDLVAEMQWLQATCVRKRNG